MKEQLESAWEWLKSRQKATLAVGAIIGALLDDPLIALVSAVL